MAPSTYLIEIAERVNSIRVLGVTLRYDLCMTTHIEETLASCSSTLYALRVLRSHGLPSHSLHEVAKMTTIAHLMYASPAWWGYANSSDKAKIEQLINRMRRCGFLPSTAPSGSALAGLADERLLKAVCSDPNHVLRHHFPPVRDIKYNLRPRPHPFTLPARDDRNFIPRILHKKAH